MEIDEIINQRKIKLEALKAKGMPIFGPSSLSGLTTLGSILADFKESQKVSVSGRLTAKRLHGKVIFADLRDSGGRIQLYIKADIIGKENFELFESVDIADTINVKGELFKTHTGEPTI